MYTTPTNNVPNSRTRSRHHLRRHTSVTILAAALMGLAACGDNSAADSAGSVVADPTTSATASPTTTTSTTTTSTTSTPVVPTTVEARPTATLDELVGSNGGRIHVRCIGQGTKTVILIAGFEEGAENWGKVEPTVSASARVCSYDRPGTGTSDPATATQTFTSQATDLHALLTTVAEPGPYLVVGHSFGGAEAITFASLFPAEVSGLVLIDTSPVTWFTSICAVPNDGTPAATALRFFCTSLSDPTANVEHLDTLASFAEVAKVTSLGSLPTTIITAVDRQFPGLAAGELARLTDEWDRGQEQWSRLSTTTRRVSVEKTSHHIQLDQPALVIDEITRLLP